jgi:hypothetical protein
MNGRFDLTTTRLGADSKNKLDGLQLLNKQGESFRKIASLGED